MYRNIKSLCYIPGTNIVLQVNYISKTNKLVEKRDQICGHQRGGLGEGGLDEGGQKVRDPSYEINMCQKCEVQHDKYK